MKVLFGKISQLREDQMYFMDMLENDHTSKGKGKKTAKYEAKGPCTCTRGNLRNSFKEDKKELMDMVNLHYN